MKKTISYILNKCSSSKFEKSYIKYLASLDFDEFEKFFSNYSSIIAKLIIRYRANKIKLFSKKWFKLSNLEYKWHLLYSMFIKSNRNFVDKITQNLEIKNNKKMSLLSKIIKTRQELESIISHPISLIPDPTTEDIIKFNLIIIDSIYTSEELTKLVDELNNIR